MKNLMILGLSLLSGMYIMFLYWLSGGNFDRCLNLGFSFMIASISSFGVFVYYKMAHWYK